MNDQRIVVRGVDVETCIGRVRSVLVASEDLEVVDTGGATFQVARRRRPLWTIVLAVLLFPIGLLFLLVRDVDKGTVAVRQSPSGAEVVVTGALAGAVREQLAGPLQVPITGAASFTVPDTASRGTDAAHRSPPPPSNSPPVRPSPNGSPSPQPEPQAATPSAPPPGVGTPPQPADDRTVVRPHGRSTPGPSGESNGVARPIRLLLPGGRHVVTSSEDRVVLGRAPGRDGADRTVTVDDPSVSKSHAAITLGADGRIMVEDLHSTNGTAVATPGSALRLVDAGSTVPTVVGSTVHLGDVIIELAADTGPP